MWRLTILSKLIRKIKNALTLTSSMIAFVKNFMYTVPCTLTHTVLHTNQVRIGLFKKYLLKIQKKYRYAYMYMCVHVYD